MKLVRFLLPAVATNLLLFAVLTAGESSGKIKPPRLDLRYVRSGPVVDGDPGDAVWAGAPSTDAFHRLGEPTSASSMTTVKALYDDESLYVLFVCRGKPRGEIRASAIRRDSPVWETDDDVEVFFMPGDQDTLYVQLATNAIGTKYDIQSSNRDYYKDFSWTAKPGWFEDRWIMEIGIPLRQFAASVKDGETWRFNFARHFHSKADSVVTWSWSPLVENLDERDRFGHLRFDHDVAFGETSLAVDWAADESGAIDNLKRLKGEVVYRPIRDYLDVALTYRATSRSFDYLRATVLEFVESYPDSFASFDMALRSIHPAATGYRAPPEVVEAMARDYETALDLDRSERDLLDLDRGLYYNETGRQERWLDIYRHLSMEDPAVAATAAYLLITRTRFRPPLGQEDLSLIQGALSTFVDHVIRGSTPIHVPKGTAWLTAFPTRQDVYEKFYNAMRRVRIYSPDDILSLCRSLASHEDLPDEARLVLMKTEFEQYYEQGSPDHDPAKADSLILVINEKDKEYAQARLNILLRDEINQLDQVYAEMGRDSLPQAVRKAVELRKHYEGFHPIDMALALCYENVDSLDRAVDYLENYRKSAGKRWRKSGPIARYLDELRFRRDHRGDPNFFTVPRDAFRLVYRLQGYRSPSNLLDISSDGTVVLYSNIPDSLDPRARIDIAVPAAVDSPAVAFRISKEEVDSLHSLLVHSGFLRFRLKNTERCYRCGNREFTLFTPWNMRTVHLEGENPSSPPFQLEESLNAILTRYLRPVFYLQTDWKALTDYYSRWNDYHSPSRSPDEKLDDLIALFNSEPVHASWQDDTWYIEPLLSLGRETGRESEVEAVIGVRYFDSAFKWRSYAKERLPKPDSRDIVKSREYLGKAAADAKDAKEREWYGFLSAFARDYSGDLDGLTSKAEALDDRENRGNARSLLVWLACANNDFERARSLHAALVSSKAGREAKSAATLRMMLYSKDHNHNESALEYLNQIGRHYRGSLKDQRHLPIREIVDYSKPDFQLDQAYLTFVSKDFDAAERMARSIDETSIPPDRKEEYEDLLRLIRYREIPESFVQPDLADYLGVTSTLGRAGLYDLSARWASWLMDHVEDAKTRSQVTSLLVGAFQKREVWDDLQVEIADKLLEDYRRDPGWKSVELTARTLQVVIDHGGPDDVKAFWRKHVQPFSIRTTQVKPLDKLAGYFSERNDIPEQLDVLKKLRAEISDLHIGSPLSRLVETKYTLDLADLYMTDLDQPERGRALVDSLADRLPDMGSEAYPYAFAAIAQWKSDREGWQALVDFVRPVADSLIAAEKNLEWNIYRPHLIPGTPLDSPLLALRCLIKPGGWGRSTPSFLDLLGLDPNEADRAIKDLKIGPRRLNLDCDQAHLLSWRDESFEEILDLFSRQIR